MRVELEGELKKSSMCNNAEIQTILLELMTGGPIRWDCIRIMGRVPRIPECPQIVNALFDLMRAAKVTHETVGLIQYMYQTLLVRAFVESGLRQFGIHLITLAWYEQTLKEMQSFSTQAFDRMIELSALPAAKAMELKRMRLELLKQLEARCKQAKLNTIPAQSTPAKVQQAWEYLKYAMWIQRAIKARCRIAGSRLASAVQSINLEEVVQLELRAPPNGPKPSTHGVVPYMPVQQPYVVQPLCISVTPAPVVSTWYADAATTMTAPAPMMVNPSPNPLPQRKRKHVTTIWKANNSNKHVRPSTESFIEELD